MASAQPNSQELEEMEQKMAELDKQIAEGQAKREEACKKFEEATQKELKEKLDSYSAGLQCNIDMTFNNLDQRMGELHDADVKTKQTDVLRLNKVIRDVSKGIAKDWKTIFVQLMAGADVAQADIDSLLKKIQRNKPAVQALKAMTTWKESGEEVDIGKLTEALRLNDKNELADHVDAILLADTEELVKIGDLPASAISKPPEGSEGATAEPDYVEPLPNSKLMALSKKIGPAWLEVASMLGLPEIDVEDIKRSEGLTYKGAFRTLFAWRDMTYEQDINQCEVLIEALKACNMTDVADMVN